MMKLQKNPQIVIRNSDKGGNIVLWPLVDYMKEAHLQLDDVQCYKRTNVHVVKAAWVEYYSKLSAWRSAGVINLDEYKFLKNEHPVMPAMYFIPKLHKNITSPPGRPIISAKGGFLENTSKCIDFFHQDFVKGLPSFVKDTGHFLRHVQEIEWGSDCLLMCLDVTSLYTSIHHRDGIRATEYYLNHRPLHLAQHNRMLITMLTFCLNNNYFLFQNQILQQIRGVAMGACFSPSYSCLHMGWWEELVLRREHKTVVDTHVKTWLRYIDDLFVIWQGSAQSAYDFVESLNTNNLNIHFTATISDQSVCF